ncbi:MAG: hypothetical protein Q7S59_01720, partial [Sulfurimonas sp.]|nr:hypothetical protein [Sulfurimonas sp.]
MGLNISLTGIAFTAMSSETIDRTNEELRNEQIVTNPTVEITSNVSYMTKEKSNLVAFNDPVSGKLAIVSLSNATMDKLKLHFGENDFFQREDGITRLDNKAEAFVGGWFGDIAYKREFLSADKNQDGNLDSNEYLDTRNEFFGHGELYRNGNISEIIEKSYVKTNANDSSIVRYNKDDYTRPSSLDEELNTTLKIDKNFDNTITLRESFNKNSKFVMLSDDKVGTAHIKEAVKKGILPEEALKICLSVEEEKKTNQIKKQEALAKLMQSNGDVSKLSAEERSLLAGELAQYKKEDKSHTVNMDILKKLDKQLKDESDINVKLDKALTKALDENITQKADTNMKEKDEQSKKTSAIGALIQNGGDVNKLAQEDKAL